MNLEFGISARELRELMEFRKAEGAAKIAELGGIEGLCDKLRTSRTNGVDGSKIDLDTRRRVFGSNVLPSKLSKSFLSLVWEALQDVTLIILEVCAIISFGLSFYTPDEDVDDPDIAFEKSEQQHSFIESLAIMLCVIVVVLIAASNDYSKERQFRLLEKRIQSENKVALIRNGELVIAYVSDVVVGDIAHVKYGESLPADGCLLLGNELMVDESSLTGESELVAKDLDTDPMMFSGTNVMEGSGKMVVTAVGVNSQAGIVMTLLGFSEVSKRTERESEEAIEAQNNRLPRRRLTNYASELLLKFPSGTQNHTSKQATQNQMDDSDLSGKRTSVLQEKLSRLALQIGYAGAAISVLTVFILIISFCVKMFVIEKRHWTNLYIHYFVKYFIIGITLLVAVVPEGLPLAVTLSLAYSVRKMMKDNNLVRHLYACETMGNATTVCCDKTGTLTTNRMTVVDAFIWDRHFPRESFPKLKEKGIPAALVEFIAEGISLNSSYASTITQKNAELPVQLGNKTECALLGFVQEMGLSYQKKRDLIPENKFTFVYTYNSKRKCMGTVIPVRDVGFRLHVKGASEVILKRCSFILGHDDSLRRITDDEYDRLIIEVVEAMARKGLRTIAICYRDFIVGGEIDWENEATIINNLICTCIVGIEDPLRPEVPEAIRICQGAGITVRMITGDNINTARAIAFKCGIVKPLERSLVLDSQQFNRKIRDSNGIIQQDLLDKVWPILRVLARSTPSDKYVLVKGIIESKIGKYREVVAVTGDGTNDGPALKKADVGFAMGISGTDVAKEASDIILTDDNFTSIVKAVMWGRNVYDSIAKFLQFQLTVAVVAATIAFAGACAIQDTPLKAVQMLWVNCIMDTFASLALATEHPTTELLLRKPFGRTQPLISVTMLKNIIGQAIYQLTIIFFLLFQGDWLLNIPSGRIRDLLLRNLSIDTPNEHFTIIFNTFILMTLFNEINSRKIYGQRNVFKGILNSPIFYTIWICSLLVQIIIVQYGGLAFSTEALTFQQWLWCILFSLGVLIWAQIIISIPVEKFYKKLRRKSNDDDYTSIRSESAIRAQYLWHRAGKRLRMELQVVRNFQSNLFDREKASYEMKDYQTTPRQNE